jgi:predicted RNA-binding Zn-ribbon protein involved in translation (DUF1610 family)
MAFVGPRILAAGFRPRHCINLNTSVCVHRRTFLGVFRKIKKKVAENRDPTPVISQDNLFHPFSKSPFPAVRARGEAIKKLAPCPICASEVRDASPKAVKFECPDCGWPTHCSEEHWKVDEEHAKYCGRLREVNEDEHDLRSGRRVWEFEFPGSVFSPARRHFVANIPVNRSARLRRSHIICKLGHILVHPTIPLDGHRALQETRQQGPDIPHHHRVCPASI